MTPAEIRSGDWLRDKGRLRRVQNVATSHNLISRDVVLVTFADTAEDSLSVHGDIPVTVWRTPAEEEPAR